MSIYRGPGKVKDATNDAASQAVIAVQKANEASAAASSETAAANSAAETAGHVSPVNGGTY